MFLLLALCSLLFADPIPIYDASPCTGNVLYTVDYTLNTCYNKYDCGSISCPSNYTDCSGLSVDGFYNCLGCTLSGQSARINQTHYQQFSNPGCTGFGINVALSSPCTIQFAVECAGKSANLTFGTFGPVSSGGTTTTGGGSSTSNPQTSSNGNNQSSDGSSLWNIF